MENDKIIALRNVEHESAACVVTADHAALRCVQSVSALQGAIGDILGLLVEHPLWSAVAGDKQHALSGAAAGNVGRADDNLRAAAEGKGDREALLTSLMAIRKLAVDKLPSATCHLREANRALVQAGQRVDKTVIEAKTFRGKRVNHLRRLSARTQWFKRRALVADSLACPAFDKVRAEMPLEDDFQAKCGLEPWWVDPADDAHRYTLNRLAFEKRERELALRNLEESKALCLATESELDIAEKSVKKLVGSLVSFESNLPPLLKDVQKPQDEVPTRVLPTSALGLPRRLLDVFLNIFNYLSIANDHPDAVCDVESVPVPHTAASRRCASTVKSSPIGSAMDGEALSCPTPHSQCVVLSFETPNDAKVSANGTATPFVLRFYYFPSLDVVTASCSADVLYNDFRQFDGVQDACLAKLFTSVLTSDFADDTGTSRAGGTSTTLPVAITNSGYGRAYNWISALSEQRNRSQTTIGSATGGSTGTTKVVAGDGGAGHHKAIGAPTSSAKGQHSKAPAASSPSSCGPSNKTPTGGGSSSATSRGGAADNTQAPHLRPPGGAQGTTTGTAATAQRSDTQTPASGATAQNVDTTYRRGPANKTLSAKVFIDRLKQRVAFMKETAAQVQALCDLPNRPPEEIEVESQRLLGHTRRSPMSQIRTVDFCSEVCWTTSPACATTNTGAAAIQLDTAVVQHDTAAAQLDTAEQNIACEEKYPTARLLGSASSINADRGHVYLKLDIIAQLAAADGEAATQRAAAEEAQSSADQQRCACCTALLKINVMLEKSATLLEVKIQSVSWRRPLDNTMADDEHTSADPEDTDMDIQDMAVITTGSASSLLARAFSLLLVIEEFLWTKCHPPAKPNIGGQASAAHPSAATCTEEGDATDPLDPTQSNSTKTKNFITID